MHVAASPCIHDITSMYKPHLRLSALRTSQGDARAVSPRRDCGNGAAAAEAAAAAPSPLPGREVRSSCGLSAGTALPRTLRRPSIVLVLPVPAETMQEMSSASHRQLRAVRWCGAYRNAEQIRNRPLPCQCLRQRWLQKSLMCGQRPRWDNCIESLCMRQCCRQLGSQARKARQQYFLAAYRADPAPAPAVRSSPCPHFTLIDKTTSQFEQQPVEENLTWRTLHQHESRIRLQPRCNCSTLAGIELRLQDTLQRRRHRQLLPDCRCWRLREETSKLQSDTMQKYPCQA